MFYNFVINIKHRNDKFYLSLQTENKVKFNVWQKCCLKKQLTENKS
jgi:hypothetical protein